MVEAATIKKGGNGKPQITASHLHRLRRKQEERERSA